MNARRLASQLAKHPAQLAIRVANRLNNTMFHKQRLRSLLFHGDVFLVYAPFHETKNMT